MLVSPGATRRGSASIFPLTGSIIVIAVAVVASSAWMRAYSDVAAETILRRQRCVKRPNVPDVGGMRHPGEADAVTNPAQDTRGSGLIGLVGGGGQHVVAISTSTPRPPSWSARRSRVTRVKVNRVSAVIRVLPGRANTSKTRAGLRRRLDGSPPPSVMCWRIACGPLRRC